MTIKEALKKYYSIEIELLLSHILGKPKEFLYMNTAHELTRMQTNKLTRMAKRRLKGEPIAYILGYKYFYGLRFKVNKNVLIPRPETELIVDKVLSAKLLVLRKNTRILDLGTGSGAIIISLAKVLNTRHLALSTKFYASDISRAALKVAKQNAKIISVKKYHSSYYDTFLPKIKFIKSDLLENIKGNFGIIIANLPYLSSEALAKEDGWHGAKNRFSSVKNGLKYEPKRALYTKEKGLMQIRRLLEQISNRTQKPKYLFLEFDPRQKTELHKMIKKILPSFKAKFYRDFNNLWRYVEIKL